MYRDASKALWYGRWTRPDGSRGKTRGYSSPEDAEAELTEWLTRQSVGEIARHRRELQVSIDRVQAHLDALKRALQALDE